MGAEWYFSIKIWLGSSTGTVNEVDLFSVKTLADPPRIYKQLVVEGKALFPYFGVN